MFLKCTETIDDRFEIGHIYCPETRESIDIKPEYLKIEVEGRTYQLKRKKGYYTFEDKINFLQMSFAYVIATKDIMTTKGKIIEAGHVYKATGIETEGKLTRFNVNGAYIHSPCFKIYDNVVEIGMYVKDDHYYKEIIGISFDKLMLRYPDKTTDDEVKADSVEFWISNEEVCMMPLVRSKVDGKIYSVRIETDNEYFILETDCEKSIKTESIKNYPKPIFVKI